MRIWQGPKPVGLHQRLSPVFALGAVLLAAGGLMQGAAAADLAACASDGQENAYMEEICALADRADIKAAFKHIEDNHERGVAEVIELTEIPAPPFGEEKRGARFAEMLEETGFGEVATDAVGNVIARREGKKGDRVIAVAAHIDTVFPLATDVAVRKRGNTYFAPGIGDNTRAMAMLLEIARAMVAHDIEADADILLIGNVGEEGLGDLRGVRHLFRDGAEKIDAFIAVDGGRRNRLIYAAIGSLRYRVIFRGPGGHSWGAFGLGNPHHALGRAIENFDIAAAEVVKTGERTTYNVGRIGGGTSVNSVPFESWMEIDMRSGDPAKLEEMDAVLKEAVMAALEEENADRARGDELTVELKPVGNRPAGKGDLETPLIQRSMAAMKAFGLEPDLRASSTDANIPISLNVPAVTLSRGGVTRGAHSLAESWTDEKTTLSTQLTMLVILSEAGLAERREAQ